MKIKDYRCYIVYGSVIQAQSRLRQPKVKERLARIIDRQQNSTRCQKLMHEMRLHVAPTNGFQ